MAKQSLTTYRGKRNFSRTAEPRGRIGAHGAQGDRYVIQKHAARRLHFDFRLEVDGVLKSWAVPKGPSLDPHEKRLAVEVEDHPLGYGDFEGTIPEGSYGAGTVQLWDTGRWSPADGVSAGAALARGKLTFSLAGQRLKGAWALVRMRRRGEDSKTSWLLIKEADSDARPGADSEIADIDESVKTGRTLADIAAGKPEKRKGREAPKAGRHPSKRRAAKRDAGSPEVMGVALSHPDKVLWPDDGITKRELADYCAAVGGRMVSFLKDRPVSIIRAPDGIDRSTFFQRHAGRGTSELVRLIRVPGEEKPFISVGDAPGLIAMAQMGAVEFHPWGCTAADLMHPDQITFDLDPTPDVAFARVVEAAKEVKRRLAALGFAAYPKTTGGKGLHVVVPLEPRAGWSEAKAFAKAVCQSMVSDQPDAYTLNMSKKERVGHIFLDYLRNELSASAVSAWSPRARDGAPIAVPLGWKSVTAALDPHAFTIRTLKAALRRADDWAEFDRDRVPVTPTAIKKAA